MTRALELQGVAAATIGQMTEHENERVLVHVDGREEPVSRLGRDELYRILEQQPRQ
jgi:hypothetical protein